MNKKKIIFLVILGIVVLTLIVILLIATSGAKKTKKTKTKNFKIWILNDSKEDFLSFINDFKKDAGYKGFNPTIETFDNYEEYYLALSSSIAKEEGPDIFMLNNNEKSLFLENITGINPNIISPTDLRTYFRNFFGEDLIFSIGEKEKKQEFLVGVPAGYETLGIFFSQAKIQDVNKLQNFSYIQNLINDKSRPGYSVIGVGKGKTVKYSSDIFTQFMMGKGVNTIMSSSDTKVKDALIDYNSYNSGKNNYGEVNSNLKNSNKNNIDAFTSGKVGAIFGYPRMLNLIDDRGFRKILLRAAPFPDFINDGAKLVNYNYFVVNKNSKNQEMAMDFLKYLFSEKGEKKYLNHFKYYLPARISLLDDLENRDIVDGYHIKLKNFYNSAAFYSSFNKGIKYIYDDKIKSLLDEDQSYITKMNKFLNTLTCKTKKVLKLENLSKKCN